MYLGMIDMMTKEPKTVLCKEELEDLGICSWERENSRRLCQLLLGIRKVKFFKVLKSRVKVMEDRIQ